MFKNGGYNSGLVLIWSDPNMEWS